MMKTPRLFLVLLLLPLFSTAQDLSGLFIGNLANDSNTVRKDQSYELALSQYKGKVTGYSYSTFIVNDTLYYIVKRVKGTIEGMICEVKDDYIVSTNIGDKLDKGVKQTNTFRMSASDSSWHLDGDWKTNRTKRYYALSGSVTMQQEKDFAKSKLLEHLGDLNLDGDLSFYQPQRPVYYQDAPKATAPRNPAAASSTREETRKTQPESAVAARSEKKMAAEKREEPASGTITPDVTVQTPSAKNEVAEKKQQQQVSNPPDVAKTEKAKEQQRVQDPKPATTQTTQPAQIPATRTQELAKQEQPTGASAVANQAVQVKETPAPKTPETSTPQPQSVDPTSERPRTARAAAIPVATNQDPTAQKLPVKNEILARNQAMQTPMVVPPAAQLAERKRETINSIPVVSDSLRMALYDNGEIDGDTVTVLLNGQVILAKQGLKSSAIKHTVYFPAGIDTLEVVLYAENLGKYPPNTGLLTIYDGDVRYEVRFSADYQKSAAVVFTRKKKQQE